VTVILADGREFPGKVVGRDHETDVAVVRIDKAPQGLIAARLGDSDSIDVGEWVLAMGFGLPSMRSWLRRSPSAAALECAVDAPLVVISSVGLRATCRRY
jgi:hypothetical protein